MFCGMDFHTRLGLLAHISDKRVRSKVRGTSCGLLFLQSSPVPLPASLASSLNHRDRLLRKLALKDGHTHAIARVPATQTKRKSTFGIPARLLADVSPNGVRRRLQTKTSPVLGNLRYKPRKLLRIACGARPPRLHAKTTLVFVQERCVKRRVGSKTPSALTPY